VLNAPFRWVSAWAVTEALAHPYLLSYASDEEMMLEGVEVGRGPITPTAAGLSVGHDYSAYRLTSSSRKPLRMLRCFGSCCYLRSSFSEGKTLASTKFRTLCMQGMLYNCSNLF
jgi:hypothetical protein